MAALVETARAKAGRISPSLNFLALALLFALSGVCLSVRFLDGGAMVFVFVLSGWLVSLCLHEFGHAYVAWLGGDDGMIDSGYLSLDPVRYADPLVTILLPLFFVVLDGFAFPGGAVLVDRSKLRSRLWEAAVSAAGPLANLLFLAAISALFLLAYEEGALGHLWEALALLGFLQAMSLVLNLLPLPGLDGYGIVRHLLPEAVRRGGDAIGGAALFLLVALVLISDPIMDLAGAAGLRTVVAFGIEGGEIPYGLSAFRFWK